METFMSIGNSCTHSEKELVLASVRPKRKEVQVERRLLRPDIRCTDVSDEGRMTNGCVNCEVREPNKKSRIWPGTYETAEVAARAYDDAALALRSRSACLNFADLVWRLPKPHSTDPKDIRKVAAESAELFSPSGREKSTMGDRTEDNSLFVDDDEEFGMAGLLESMAEGLLMPPPPREGNVNDCGDEENGSGEPLWSFSV